MTQSMLWQNTQQSQCYAEICNALYERELRRLVENENHSVKSLSARIQSLPYYIKKTAQMMTSIDTPLILDSQNASWNNKQSATFPLSGQSDEEVMDWYNKINITPGLVIPIALAEHIVLDCVDRIDLEKKRFRTNVFGWHSLTLESVVKSQQLLKPTKRVLIAASAGHCWRNNIKTSPIIPSLRELLLSCQINWRNIKKPLKLDDV